MGEPKQTRVGKVVRRTARLTTGTAVAATEVMVMSFNVTRRVSGRITRRVLPGGRGQQPPQQDG